MSFETFAVESIYMYMLVFCRVGTTLMLMSGFGEVHVNGRARMLLGIAMAFVIAPVVSTSLPSVPGSVAGLFVIIALEITVGAFFGFITRMIQASLHVGGMVIAFQSGLASAVLFDPSQGSQGSVFGNFLSLLGTTLFFVASLHHLMIYGLVQSYMVIIPGEGIPLQDSAVMIARTMADMFKVGLAVGSPMIIVGLIMYLAAGIMARLMPNMQVFFVLIPAQILVGFILLATTVSAMMLWYLRFYEETMRYLFKF